MSEKYLVGPYKDCPYMHEALKTGVNAFTDTMMTIGAGFRKPPFFARALCAYRKWGKGGVLKGKAHIQRALHLKHACYGPHVSAVAGASMMYLKGKEYQMEVAMEKCRRDSANLAKFHLAIPG